MSGLPQALTPLASTRCFVLWRDEPGEDGKRRKVPYQVTGRRASSTNPKHWSAWPAVERALGRGGYAGPGVVLGDHGGGRCLVGVDLDLCRSPASGALMPWAVELVGRAGTYAEVSPSGTGVKLFGYLGEPINVSVKEVTVAAPVPEGAEGADHGAPEIGLYPDRRYFTITGRHVPGTADVLADVTGFVRELARDLERQAAQKRNGHADPPASVRRLLERDLKLRALWDRGSGPGDRSANDLALAGALRRAGVPDGELRAALAVYPLGQIGGGKLAGAAAERRLDRILAELAEPPALERPRLAVLDAGAFLALEIPERKLLLDPILPERGLVMLYAPRGVGKTHVALSIAYAVASGGRAFRWQAPAPTPVLYVDGEMPARSLQERLAGFVQAGPVEPPEGHLRFALADLHEDGLPDLCGEDGQQAIEAALADARLLVLDNLSALVRSGRENEADSWQPVQDFLLRLRRRGVSVLIVHHAGKGGQQRGTSRREDVLDTVISLRRPQDYQPSEGARFEVHIEKARGVAGVAVDPFEARLEVRNGVASWTMRGIEDAELRRVVALTEDGFSTRDVAAETGFSAGKVSKLQNRARELGLLGDRPKRGPKPRVRRDGRR